MDHLDKEKRSWNMAQIRAENTKPEITVRSLLHSLGYRFRLHRRDLPGVPDIVLPKLRLVIFVHGCFWHRHQKCKSAYTPKTREEFWNAKFKSNIDRDKRAIQALRKLGWRVVIVWECETKHIDSLTKRLGERLRSHKLSS